MSQPPLIPGLPEPLEGAALQPLALRDLRLRRPERNQLEMQVLHMDSLLPADHPARAIWDLLEKLDLSAFYTSIQAADDRPGRPATDPEVLLGVWLLATVDGVGSARRLAKLCKEHDAYRWMCGGVPINYHMLSDFRVAHAEELDGLLTQIVAALLSEDLVRLDEVAQDGMRVRADAGEGSFRRRKSLEACLEASQEQVARLAKQREHPDPGANRRERAARERAAQERQERVSQALSQLPRLEAVKERQKRHAGKKRAARVSEARISTTDPDARKMKMADGGFRPAYNVQVATDVASQVIVGVGVVNNGTDQGQALGMADQVFRRTGCDPGAYLVDGGFVDLDEFVALERRGIEVYAPPKGLAGAGKPRGKTKWKTGAAGTCEIAGWRERMDSEAGKAVYRRRASSAECVNALFRARYGLWRFGVRGLAKVRSVALLLAITHNLMRWLSLRAEHAAAA